MDALILVLAASAMPLAGQTVERAASGVIEIPLRVHADRLYVPVQTSGGETLDFLLSTGSSVTVLSETGARALGEAGSLSFGGEPVSLSGSQTLPDANLTAGDKVFGGMVSSNTLNRFDVLVDAPGGRLLLKAPGSTVTWPGVALSEPTRLQVFHGVTLGIDVELNGRNFPGLLDLGTPAVLANAKAMSEAGLADGPARLKLAGVTVEGVEVRETDHPAVQAFAAAGNGFVLVGSAVVQDCVVSLSWVHREIRTCVR